MPYMEFNCNRISLEHGRESEQRGFAQGLVSRLSSLGLSFEGSRFMAFAFWLRIWEEISAMWDALHSFWATILRDVFARILHVINVIPSSRNPSFDLPTSPPDV